MGRLSNTDFLAKFGSVLEENNGSSSIYLTQKRLAHTPIENSESSINDLSSNVIDTEQFPKNNTQYPILIRVSMNGDGKEKKKNKISTVVEHNNLDNFWTEYVQVIKTGFVGLKKKEKKKGKKGSKISK